MIGKKLSNGWKTSAIFSNDWKKISPVFQRLEKIFRPPSARNAQGKRKMKTQRTQRVGRKERKGVERGTASPAEASRVSAGEVKGQVGDVFEAFATDESFHLFHDVLASVGSIVADGGKQFWEGKMVNTVDVSGAQREGSQPRRERFARNDHDVGQMPLAVADEVERFGPAVLGAVAPHGPLGGNGSVEKG